VIFSVLVLRLVFTQENYPWIGLDKNIFLCVKVISQVQHRAELTRQRKIFLAFMYSGEYDVCDVSLSVYPHRPILKNMPGHGGNRTYDLWNTIAQLAI
jgi:hypothetical protein